VRELDECLRLSRQIKEKEEQIIELRSRIMSPKNQTISDMPKGGGGYNEIESFIIKLELLENNAEYLKVQRALLWNNIRLILHIRHIKSDIERLLYLRFYNGNSWNKCVETMSKEYPNCKWNANKCFRAYRYVVKENSEKSEKVC
jgi:hypothetical protein